MSNSEKKIYKVKLINKKNLTANILELQFEKPNNFTFEPGQFVQFQILYKNKIILRSYSLSSISSDPYLEFCIKLLPNGIGSTFIKKMNIGNILSFIGPNGQFVKEKKQQSSFFVATSTGLTPIMSILRSFVPTNTTKKKIYIAFWRSYRRRFILD